MFASRSSWDETENERHMIINFITTENNFIWADQFGNLSSSIFPVVKKVKDNFTVYHPGISYIPLNKLKGLHDHRRLMQLKLFLIEQDFEPHIFCTDDPDAIGFMRYFGPRNALTIYFDFEPHGKGYDHSYARPMYLRADLVFTSAPYFYEREKESANVYLVLPGVSDFEPFDIPYSDSGLKSIGYFGPIGKMVDLELLKEIRDEGKYQLVIGGPVTAVDSLNTQMKDEWMDFLSSDTVDYLGSLSYDNLREFMATVDLLLMPYHKDTVFKHYFPRNYFEYLSAGKPILATEFYPWPAEYARYVYLVKEGQEINAAAETAYGNHTETLYRDAISLAYTHRWSERYQKLTKTIKQTITAKAVPKASE